MMQCGEAEYEQPYKRENVIKNNKIDNNSNAETGYSLEAQRPAVSFSNDGGRKAEGLIRAWFNNRMWVILMAIENPHFKDFRFMMQIEFFLEEIEHHFLGFGTARYFWNAFRYLRCFFKAYPRVNHRHSDKALEMIGRIYQAMGYEFRFHSNVKPALRDGGDKLTALSGNLQASHDQAAIRKMN